MSPRLLDLMCGAGGSAIGYARAGFEVVGVDNKDQPNYPYEFVKADVFDFLAATGPSGLHHEFDAVHASPPCQAGCALTKGTNAGRVYPQLIPDTRRWLDAIDLPWVIENVAGAPIRKDLMLCGSMFGLDVQRHRYFEFGGDAPTPVQPEHDPTHGGERVRGWRHGEYFEGRYLAVYGDGGGKGTVEEWQQAMGIFHTDVRKEIAEAVPPRYCEHIGGDLFAYVNAKAAA